MDGRRARGIERGSTNRFRCDGWANDVRAPKTGTKIRETNPFQLFFRCLHASGVTFIGNQAEAADPKAVGHPQKQTLRRGKGISPLHHLPG